MSISVLSPARRAMISTFGLGRMRPASGTWGSLPPLILAAALALICGCDGASPGARLLFHAPQALILIAFSAACIFWGDQAEMHYADTDPADVVADETAGMALTLLFIPASAFAHPLHAVVILAAAFVLWRIMDILKPWPANALQNIPGGWGILLDDLAAAIYAGLTLTLFRALW